MVEPPSDSVAANPDLSGPAHESHPPGATLAAGKPYSGAVVVGADAGGTSTRVCVVTRDGQILSRGIAGGSNLNSSADPAGSLNAAMISALDGSGVHAAQVVRCVVGMAGSGPAGYQRSMAVVARAWENAGQAAPIEVVSDVLAAYATGTASPRGSVLIVGTGAAAAWVDSDTILARSDGVGYLIGDEGAAVWVALHALRAVAAALDGRGPQTRLTDLLCEALDVLTVPREDLSQALVGAVYGTAPAALGGLAPQVGCAAAQGDAVALGIVDRGVAALSHSLEVVRRQDQDAPVVLAGGLALSEGYLGTRLRARVRELTGREPDQARYCAAGAAAIAMRGAFGAQAGSAVDALVAAR